MLSPSHQLRLNGILDELKFSAQTELGYPCAFDLDYSALAHVDVRGMHIVNQDESAGIVALETSDAGKAREVLSDLLLPG